MRNDNLSFQRGDFEAQQRMAVLNNYYKWIYEKIKSYIGNRVLDAGCGIGNMIYFLKEKELVVGIDVDPIHISQFQKRFKKKKNIKCLELDLTSFKSNLLQKYNFDTILCLDVIEHIEKDQELLRKFFEVLDRDGRLIIKTPALKFLYGSCDEASSHFRRYSKEELKKITQRARFTIENISYMNIFGVVPYYINSKILKKKKNFSKTLDKRKLGFYNKIIPILAKIEEIFPPPFGLSLIVVLKK